MKNRKYNLKKDKEKKKRANFTENVFSFLLTLEERPTLQKQVDMFD